MPLSTTIGSLRHRVTLQTATATQNASGEAVAAWADAADLWAEVAPVAPREVALARSFADTVSHRVTIRYRAGVRPKVNRFEFGTRVFDIDGVVNTQERNVELVCYCTERLS